MDRLRKALQKLDWPVDRLSDQQISDELCRRWLEADTSSAFIHLESGAHAAWGVFARMARAGNLDVLCWEADSTRQVTVPHQRQPIGSAAETEGGAASRPGRSVVRQAPKPPGMHDALDWQAVDTGHCASGWLVQCADAGLAFVAESAHVPPLGAEILPTIRARSGAQRPLGHATIVRTDMLNRELALVCAELKEPWIAHG